MIDQRRNLRVGVVGCGGLGRHEAKLASEMEGIQVVGVSDVIEENAQSVAGEIPEVRAFTDHRSLIDLGLDCVLVVTPTHTHKEVCLDMAKAGVPIFCEKPMATSVADCDAMLQAAERNNVSLMLGFVMRFWPVFQEMHRRLASGDIGELRLAWTTRMGGRPPAGIGDWRRDRTKVGGLYSGSIHEMDILCWMGGVVESVHGSVTRGVFAEEDAEDSILVTMNYQNGAIGSLMSSQIYTVGASNLGIAGTEGSMRKTSNSELQIADHKGNSEIIEVVDVANGLHDELAHFFDCVRSGASPSPDGIDGRNSLEIFEAAYRSAERGEVVKLQQIPRPSKG